MAKVFEGIRSGLKRLAAAPAAARSAVREGLANFRVRYFPRKPVVLEASAGLAGAPDPAKLFGPVSGRDVASAEGPLLDQVQSIAHRIVDRKGRVDDAGREMVGAIAGSADSAVTIVAWIVRLLVGIVWAYLAASLFMAYMQGTAHVPGVGEIAPQEFRPLVRLFGFSAGAAILASSIFLFAALLRLASNDEVKKRARAFGKTAGDYAKDFGDSLDELLQRMSNRDPVAAVKELSRAHLTALEAAVFFREIDFLTDDRASAHFRGYCRKFAGAFQPSELLAFLAGLFVGLTIGFMAWGPVPEVLRIPQLAEIPPAMGWILAGVAVFATAGLLAESLRGAIGPIARRLSEGDAHIAAVAGFAGTQAPRGEDVVRRIEDAVRVFQEMLGEWRAQKAHAAESETPSWRRAPEGPRFVETAFAATPKPFLADGKKRRS